MLRLFEKKKKKMLKVQHRLMNLDTIFLGHFHCKKKNKKYAADYAFISTKAVACSFN
jgi:predicted phosphodiesterase